MLRLITRRLLTGGLSLFLITLLVFVLIQWTAGDPFAESADDTRMTRMPPAALEELRRAYRLDEPLYRQYLLWLGDALTGDLGRSLHDRRPVSQKIGERLGITLTLNFLSILLMVGVAVPLGTAAALRPGSRIDRFGAWSGYLLYALPVFWAGLMLQIFFSMKLGWLPVAGLQTVDTTAMGPVGRAFDRAAHLVMPVICLSYGGVAYLSRFVRATLLDNVAAEGTRAARARGLGEWAILIRHGFRLAAVPMLTLAGLLLPALVAGSLIVETVFAIPGLGRLFVEAAGQRDLPVLLGLTLLSGAATLAGILAADVAYVLSDPRVRRG